MLYLHIVWNLFYKALKVIEASSNTVIWIRLTEPVDKFNSKLFSTGQRNKLKRWGVREIKQLFIARFLLDLALLLQDTEKQKHQMPRDLMHSYSRILFQHRLTAKKNRFSLSYKKMSLNNNWSLGILWKCEKSCLWSLSLSFLRAISTVSVISIDISVWCSPVSNMAFLHSSVDWFLGKFDIWWHVLAWSHKFKVTEFCSVKNDGFRLGISVYIF